MARTLTAWSVTGNAAVAALTALCDLLAGLTSARSAIAGLVIIATPLLRHHQGHLQRERLADVMRDSG